MDYLFEFFHQHAQLMDACICKMPDGTGFNSLTSRSVKPKDPNKDKNKGKHKHTNIAKTLNQIAKRPLKIHKSRHQRMAERAHMMRQHLKLDAGLHKLEKRTQERLDQVNSAILCSSPNSKMHHQQKKQALERQMSQVQSKIDSVFGVLVAAEGHESDELGSEEDLDEVEDEDEVEEEEEDEDADDASL